MPLLLSLIIERCGAAVSFVSITGVTYPVADGFEKGLFRHASAAGSLLRDNLPSGFERDFVRLLCVLFMTLGSITEVENLCQEMSTEQCSRCPGSRTVLSRGTQLDFEVYGYEGLCE